MAKSFNDTFKIIVGDSVFVIKPHMRNHLWVLRMLEDGCKPSKQKDRPDEIIFDGVHNFTRREHKVREYDRLRQLDEWQEIQRQRDAREAAEREQKLHALARIFDGSRHTEKTDDKPKRGRRPGTGGYQKDDAFLHKEMKKLIDSGRAKSVAEAASIVG
jgi:hypothetical protein